MFFPAREFDGLTFILHRFIWVAIYWLYLVHSINEKVESTLPSSLLIRVLIIITALSFIIQKKHGVFKNFIAITFGLVLVFIHTIIVLHLLLNTFPDIYDFVFYYEFF